MCSTQVCACAVCLPCVCCSLACWLCVGPILFFSSRAADYCTGAGPGRSDMCGCCVCAVRLLLVGMGVMGGVTHSFLLLSTLDSSSRLLHRLGTGINRCMRLLCGCCLAYANKHVGCGWAHCTMLPARRRLLHRSGLGRADACACCASAVVGICKQCMLLAGPILFFSSRAADYCTGGGLGRKDACVCCASAVAWHIPNMHVVYGWAHCALLPRWEIGKNRCRSCHWAGLQLYSTCTAKKNRMGQLCNKCHTSSDAHLFIHTHTPAHSELHMWMCKSE
jgi:hypothetical protein